MEFFRAKENRNSKKLVELSENIMFLTHNYDILNTKLLQLEIQLRSLRGLINRKVFPNSNSEDIEEKKHIEKNISADGLDSLRK